ncbi:MAG: ABC-2 family transporter protein, partial [Spirochaetales bacterium]|nr:ABC-2 family transporter protein [Spirochaetales bacterium]
IFIVPYAFISYFPAVYLFDKAPWGAIAWLSPLVALWLAFVAKKIFYIGLSRYESAGN